MAGSTNGSFGAFARTIKGKKLLERLFSSGCGAVPAWLDETEGRLKMCWKRTEAVELSALLEATTRRSPGAIACLTSGLIVLDLDRKNGKDGVALARKRWGRHLLEETLTIATPRGGYHLWFRVPRETVVSTRADFMGMRGVDVMGTRAVVPLPGSVTNHGRYEPLSFIRPRKLPSSMLEELQTQVTERVDPPVRRGSTTRYGSFVLRDQRGKILDSSYPASTLRRAAFIAGRYTRDIGVEAPRELARAAVDRGLSPQEAVSVASRAFQEGACYPARPTGGRSR